MSNKIICCCCSRQIVSYKASDDYIVGGGRIIFMGPGKNCCHECAEDLDDDGLFPEERR
jgi:hypothetical protein